MNCFSTLNCHFELNAHTYCIYQGKLRAIITGSWGKRYREYSLWTECSHPGGTGVIRAQEQCGFSTSPSFSSSNRAVVGQNSRAVSFTFSPSQPSLSSHFSLPDSIVCPTQSRWSSRACRGMGMCQWYSLSLSALGSRAHSALEVMSHPQTLQQHYTPHMHRWPMSPLTYLENADKVYIPVWWQHVLNHAGIGQLLMT